MRPKVKNKITNSLTVKSDTRDEYKTLTYYDYNNFNKKIFRYLGYYSKKLYNQYIFCYQIYEIYKYDIFKNLHDDLAKNININCDTYISNKLSECIDNYILIKNEHKLNNSYIYKKIIEHIRKNNIIVKNSNYENIKNDFIESLKNDTNIRYDKKNYDVLYSNIIINIVKSIYIKNYNVIKENMTNHEEMPFIDNELIDDIKNERILTFDKKNHYKDLIYEKYPNIKGITSDQNIVSKIVRIRNNDIVINLDSTLICNVMNKAYKGYVSYYRLKQLGHKRANKPKFLNDDVFNLIYTGSKAKIIDNKIRLFISDYLSNNFNSLFTDYVCIANNKYVNKKYLKLISNKKIIKKHNYIVGNYYIPQNDNHIYDSRYIYVNIPEKIVEKKIGTIEIVFDKDDVRICISYINDNNNTVTSKIVKSSECISIDLGIKNLMTIYDPIGESSIICGKYLTSINYHYNKKISEAQTNDNSLNLSKYHKKRCNVINNYFNLLVKWMERKFSDKKAIIIGYNNNWKNGVNMGSRTNMIFYNIPYCSLLKKIKYKFFEKNINVILQEESYTSKCDSLSLEEIKKHDNYQGLRIKRGLYSSGKKVLINADLNGAINMRKKLLLENIIDNKRIFNPKKVNIFQEVI